MYTSSYYTYLPHLYWIHNMNNHLYIIILYFHYFNLNIYILLHYKCYYIQLNYFLLLLLWIIQNHMISKFLLDLNQYLLFIFKLNYKLYIHMQENLHNMYLYLDDILPNIQLYIILNKSFDLLDIFLYISTFLILNYNIHILMFKILHNLIYNNIYHFHLLQWIINYYYHISLYKHKYIHHFFRLSNNNHILLDIIHNRMEMY